jgi:hypothetical protein
MLLQSVLIYCLDLKIKNGVLTFSCSNGNVRGSVRNGNVRGSVRNGNVRGSVRSVRDVRDVRDVRIRLLMPVGFQLGDLKQRVTLLLRLLRYRELYLSSGSLFYNM